MFKNSRIQLFLLALSVCVGTAADWQSVESGKSRPLRVPPSAAAGFRLLAPASTSVIFTNSLSEHQATTNRTLYNGSGVATGDFDGDGRADLVFAGIESRIEIFRNLGGWQFTNVTRASGVSVTNLVCRGVVLADIDGDGPLDLLVSANGRGVLCWRNNGQGQFTEITMQAGTASPFGSLTMTLADIDANGTLDMYVANNRSDDIRDRGQVQLLRVGGKPVVPPALRNRLAIFNGQILEYGEPDILLLNDGGGRFRAANWSQTMFDESGKPLPGATLDWALTAAFRDLNGDLAPDLYVCNDFWTPDRIWFNDGRGKFHAAPPLAIRQISASSMGVDTADLDFDGSPEILVLDMLSRSPAWRKRQMEAQPSFPSQPGIFHDRPQVLRNTLFLSRGDGTYAEIANFSGLAASEWAWQPLFLDVDLDGHEDLLITTGHARDVQDRDANAAIRARQKSYQSITNLAERRRAFTADLLENMRLYPELRTPIIAFRNRGDLRFEDLTAEWGTQQDGIHHGIATADFDGDGDLDFAVNNLNGPAALYENLSNAPRVAVRLRGKAPNTQAIGAQVSLRGGALPIQRREIVSGGRYLSGCDPMTVFAAGTNGAEMTLEITWRDGSTQSIAGLQGNHAYEIEQKSEPKPSPTKPRNTPVKTWFNDASAKLQHTHHEILFNDFARQPLLPHRLSQLGPGVCWTDLNGDGWSDLVIGTGAGGTLGAFRNDQKGGFVPLTNAPFDQPLPRDTTTLLSLPTREGKPSILAGLASYEDGFTNSACLFRYDLSAGRAVAAFPDLSSSLGPISAADYDADGDLDLFLGARVKPGQWPRAGGSVLLRRESGNWTPFDFSTDILGTNTPVSASLWTDLNSDGFPELVVAGEFGPIHVFHNNRGELEALDWQVRDARHGQIPLAKLSGWWTSLAAGDFDGDGLMDLLAGNWGLNSEHHASLKRPLKLYSGIFPPARSLAIIETAFDSSLNAFTPARPFDDLLSDLPFLAGKFPTYRQYSEATLDQVLGDRRHLAHEHTINTLETVLLLNRKNHFELRPLPREAQFAPVFGMSVADFDLDGAEDLFLAGNFFAMRVGVARLDASRGLLLRGDGRGSFETVAAAESGLSVYGEQRGTAVADYDRDGRPDLVVTQNGAATKLYRNSLQASGLRVRLAGPPENRDGIGCVLRLKRGSRRFPAREIHAGSGCWSQDSPVAVLPIPPADGPKSPLELEVRWPGGNLYSVQVPEGSLEYTVQF